jgi:hypothetical protein
MSEIIGNLTKIALLQQQTSVMIAMQMFKAYPDMLAYNMPYQSNICNPQGKKK